MNGRMQQIDPNNRCVQKLIILKGIAKHGRQWKQANIERSELILMIIVNTIPVTRTPRIIWIYAVATFGRSPLRGWKICSSPGTFERSGGKSSHRGWLLANPTQNCFVPMVQFRGTSIAVVATLAALWAWLIAEVTALVALGTWLTALEIAVAAILATLSNPVWKGWMSIRLFSTCSAESSNPVTLNWKGVISLIERHHWTPYS